MASRVDFTVNVYHPRYVTDALIQAKVAGVDLSSDIGHPAIDQTIAAAPPDTTVVTLPGQITRTFSIIFTPEFLVSYPTDAEQNDVWLGMFYDLFRTGVPCTVDQLTIAFVLVP